MCSIVPIMVTFNMYVLQKTKLLITCVQYQNFASQAHCWEDFIHIIVLLSLGDIIQKCVTSIINQSVGLKCPITLIVHNM